jgi:hypothetical protein
MSFSMTTEAVRNRTKTVTRRLGWDFLKPGDLLWAVEKGMGLKKGEKVKRLGLIRVTACHRELLSALINPYYYNRKGRRERWSAQADVVREGFPDLTPQQFVEMFCRANRCYPGTLVNRIEFEYVEGGGDE